jgi:PQQ-like domain
MKQLVVTAFVGLACASVSYPQGRPLDWPFFGGNAQRTGWEKNDYRITRENVKDFQLVLKRKLGTNLNGPRSLSPPVVIGLLISYRGFKELAFVSDSHDELWSIDADLERVFWKKQLESDSHSAPQCSASITAVPALTPPTNFAARRPASRSTPAAAPPVGNPGSSAGSILGSTGFGAPRPAFALSSDGKLHVLNTSTGDDVIPAIPFLPSNSKASSLTISDGVLYTTTVSGCGGKPGAVWSIDLSGPDRQVHSFLPGGGNVLGLGGLAIGNDGTIYVQTGDGPLDPASNKWSNTLLALAPKELTLKNYFLAPVKAKGSSGGATPVVFEYQGRDLIVSAGSDGRLYLLDSQSPGGEDHKTPLFQTPPLTSGNRGVWGGLSSWQDSDGTRWVLAPVWGPVNSALKLPVTNGPAPNGSIVAFKVEDQNGKPVLTPAWASRDMNSPQPPVITAGVAFALASGEHSSHATLYAFDGATGKEIYSTGTEVTAPGNLTGVTLANGRVYFTTTDGTLYAFGVFLEVDQISIGRPKQ